MCSCVCACMHACMRAELLTNYSIIIYVYLTRTIFNSIKIEIQINLLYLSICYPHMFI